MVLKAKKVKRILKERKTKTEVVEKFSANQPTSEEGRIAYEKALERLDAICGLAHQQGVAIYIDAEESWTQDCIDHIK